MISLAVVLATVACDVEVLMNPGEVDAPAAVEVHPSDVDMYPGDEMELGATVFDSAGNELSDAEVTWTSSAESIVTVEVGGQLVAIAAGESQVIASVDQVSDTATVHVSEDVPASVEVDPGAVELSPGDEEAIEVTVMAESGSELPDSSVTWTSTEESVATVDPTGRVTAVETGEGLVIASAGNAADTVDVLVGSGSSSSASVEVDPADIEMHPGDEVVIDVTAQAEDGSEVPANSVTWTSTEEAIATVESDGRVTAVAVGVSRVIASVDEAADTATVRVTDDDSDGTSELADLPRDSVDIDWRDPTGDTIRVGAGDDLQAAIDDAARGDLILLAEGVTFDDDITLGSKSGSGWITIMTDTELPAAGTRIDPSYSGDLAVIQAPTGQTVLTVSDDASGWRITGVEIRPGSGTSRTTSLVAVETGSADIIFDRVYLHGQSDSNVRRCLLLHAAGGAVVDSYLDNCHDEGFDTQAILAYNTPGPLHIENNYLAGAGENVMIGGSDPDNADMVPSDIIIRRNHFHKPMSWEGVWTVKNLLEFKLGRRILVEGNVFENNWTHAQDGFGLVFKSANQGGGDGRFSTLEHLTFRYNIVRNVENGLKIAGDPTGEVDVPTHHLHIHDNLWEAGSDYSIGRAIQAGGGGPYVFANNRIVGNNGVMPYEEMTSLSFTANIFDVDKYSVKGSGEGPGTATLDAYAEEWTFDGNELLGSNDRPVDNPDGNCFTEGECGAGPDQATIDALTTGVK